MQLLQPVHKLKLFKTLIINRFQGIYFCAHKTATLTSIQHTVPGGLEWRPWPSQILVYQLTLSQLGRQIMPPTLYPLDFLDPPTVMGKRVELLNIMCVALIRQIENS